MTTTNATLKVAHSKTLLNSWDAAVREAERQIAEARSRIGILQRSKKNLEQCRDRGDPFPATFGSECELLGQKGLLCKAALMGLA